MSTFNIVAIIWTYLFASIFIQTFDTNLHSVTNSTYTYAEFLLRLPLLHVLITPKLKLIENIKPQPRVPSFNFNRRPGKKRRGRRRRCQPHTISSLPTITRKQIDSYLETHWDTQLHLLDDLWESNPDAWEIYYDSRHKYVHSTGCHEQYSHLLELQPDFDVLLQDKLLSGSFSRPLTDNFAFVADNIFATRNLVETIQDAHATPSVYFSSRKDECPIVFDSGASVSITPFITDFTDEALQPVTGSSLSGLTGKASIGGQGTVSWIVRDDIGNRVELSTKAYYIPNAKVRLFSPQAYFRENKPSPACFNMHETGSTFTFASSETVTFNIESYSPSFLPIAHIDDYDMPSEGEVYNNITVIDDANRNLTQNEKELLRWHYKIGHFNMPTIQNLMRSGRNNEAPILQAKFSGASSIHPPLCSSCQLGKQRKRPHKAKYNKDSKEAKGALSKENLRPGDVVSVDHYQSALKGRLPNTKGKEKASEMYTGGTIFVDHASGYVGIGNQVSLLASDTIRSKRRFEQQAGLSGVHIKAYHGDNGVFRSTEFKNECTKRQQGLEFSGVGAHHQNGIAERNIQTIMNSARTMLIHTSIYWPEQPDILLLWPFAVKYAAHLFNHTPNRYTKLAPIEIFTSSRVDPTILRNSHVWGCPVYVLEPKLQDGHKLPKWQPRSRRGQFLGFSDEHASTVSLVLNLNTGNVSPQFHVVFDDWFTTIPSHTGLEDFQVPDNWKNLFETSTMNSVQDWIDDPHAPPPPELSNEWLTEGEIRARRESIERTPFPAPPHPPTQAQPPKQAETPANDSYEAPPDVAPLDDDEDDDDSVSSDVPTPDGHLRRSSRSTRGRTNRRYYNENIINAAMENTEEQLQYHQGPWNKQNWNEDDALNFLANLPNEVPEEVMKKHPPLEIFQAMLEDAEVFSDNFDESGLFDGFHPFAFHAKVNAMDTPSFADAMNGPDREGFLMAMDDEIQALEKLGAWDVVDRTEALNSGKSIIDSTWVLRRKRYPDMSVRKLKARICCRGDQQVKDVDYFETYAPVVNWSTVRMMLTMSHVLGLKSKQVDYSNAFVQSDLEDPVYVEMPALYKQRGKVLKLKKALYGLAQSPLNWFEHLKENGLEKCGFKQSEYDPCLFYTKDVICLVYVDDCLFFSKSEEDIDKSIEQLRKPNKKINKPGFDLNVEDDAAGFLGILIKRTKEGVELLQTGLIDRIIQITGLENAHEKNVPAPKNIPGKDPDGDPCNRNWSYSSVIGMLIYLATNSRPDIAFATSHYARFTSCPKASHERGLVYLIKYLKKTRNRGLILRPKQSLELDLYCDADFAGLWGIENPEDPKVSKSRSGWVITLGGAPLLWNSKLQTKTALSTLESEYLSLSHSMKNFIPIRWLVGEAANILKVLRKRLSVISKVWEDNNAARQLANYKGPRMSPRTRYIANDYHWFRENIIPGQIEINRIDTEIQLADIFTKPLAFAEFATKRRLLMGW